ncbi:MAG TPA: hypothetical protein VLK35_07980 [Methylomirabilota bacterium]|nr:hypothetical protein [Methylomirabilota bacterium]
MDGNIYAVEMIAAQRLADLRAAGARAALIESAGPRPGLVSAAGVALIRAGQWLAGSEALARPNARVRAAR